MKHRVQVRFWYGIFLSVFTAVLAIVLIILAAQIYYADPNGDPYSRALVGERLSPLLAPAILYLAAVIGGFVLAALFPLPKEKERSSLFLSYKRLRAKVPQGSGEEFSAERGKLKKYETVRLAVWGVCAAVSLAAAIVTICYLADLSHFTGQEISGEVLRMLRFCLPFIGAAILLWIGAALYETFTLKRRLTCVKKLLVLGKGAPAEEPFGLAVAAERALGVVRSEKALWIIRGAVLVLGVTFLVLGIVNGGAGDVYTKAIKICTECIGLG